MEKWYTNTRKILLFYRKICYNALEYQGSDQGLHPKIKRRGRKIPCFYAQNAECRPAAQEKRGHCPKTVRFGRKKFFLKLWRNTRNQKTVGDRVFRLSAVEPGKRNDGFMSSPGLSSDWPGFLRRIEKRSKGFK